MSQDKNRTRITSAPAVCNTGTSTPARKLKEQLGEHDKNATVIELAEDFLKVKEIAAAMRVSSSVVVRLIKEGRLSAINVSSGLRPTYRIPKTSFEKFQQDRVIPPPRIVPNYRPSLPPGVEWIV